jgi:hypothetical protein
MGPAPTQQKTPPLGLKSVNYTIMEIGLNICSNLIDNSHSSNPAPLLLEMSLTPAQACFQGGIPVVTML